MLLLKTLASKRTLNICMMTVIITYKSKMKDSKTLAIHNEQVILVTLSFLPEAISSWRA